MDLSDEQKRALALVADFRSHPIGVWPTLDRSAVADGLNARIIDATLISSRYSGLCGSASVIYQIASADPEAYAKTAISLYDSGHAKLRSLTIDPSSTFRSGILPAGNNAADWLVLGSLRDSENWIFTYKGTGHWLLDGIDDAKAIQMPHTVATWMEKFGYSDIHNETNLVSTKGWDNLLEANNLFSKNYKVSLFVNSCMLKTKTQEEFSILPDHWIGMSSKGTSSSIQADPNSKFNMKVYSWGAIQTVPQDTTVTMHPKIFLRNYYGYVAGKP